MVNALKQQVGLGPKVRLGILTQFYPPDYAATGQLIEELAQNLGELGLEVQIFTGQPGYAFNTATAPTAETQKQVRVRRSQTSRLWPHRIRGRAINGLLFTLRAIVRVMTPWRKFDILLITTEPPYLNVLGLLASKILGIPYICLMYDLYPDVAVALKVLSPRHWLVRFWTFLNRQIWQEAQALIVLSSTMRDRITDHCPQVASKIAIIHSWSDPTLIQPRAKTQNWFAQQHHLDRKFTVLYSGNMGRCHDVQTLLETVKELRHEPIQFVFIGSGAKYPQLQAAVAAVNLTNCLFLPYQDKKVLPYSLTACDVALVSIEQGMEGLVVPSKLYGSLAAGRPIAAICEEHSYLREILNNGHCGQAFCNRDSLGLAQFLRYLSKNPSRAAEMGRNGFQYLKHYFTPQQIAYLYGHVIHQCLEAKTLGKTLNFARTMPQPGILPAHLRSGPAGVPPSVLPLAAAVQSSAPSPSHGSFLPYPSSAYSVGVAAAAANGVAIGVTDGAAGAAGARTESSVGATEGRTENRAEPRMET
ncbi:MAG: glycosyltransferase family 4 protein, partial [Prochlorothrix sp.]